MDFEGIELLSFDAVSEIPSITWRVKDFAQAGVAFEDFYFQTVMQDGLPGLAIIDQPEHVPEVDSALVPKLLQTNTRQLDRFLGFTNTEFRQIRAAATVLAQLESLGWKNFELPNSFDLSFWRPILKQLVSQVLSLPAVLRYDEVKLKRELINPDYEHLWLEFHGLNHGAISLRKFEVRLGAALIQTDGFSKFPKFEIPLIDGKTKPFESWYAESHDDHGAKFELRFSIEKNAFDVAVWNQVSDADKAMLLRLIYAFPEALRRLESQGAVIHRPWAAWIGFAKDAVGVLEFNRKAMQAASTNEPAAADSPPQPQSQPQPGPGPAVKQAGAVGAQSSPAPVRTPVANPGVKLINISGASDKPAKPAKLAKPTKPVAAAKKTPVKSAQATKSSPSTQITPMAKKGAQQSLRQAAKKS
jgi:hypothetical protein